MPRNGDQDEKETPGQGTGGNPEKPDNGSQDAPEESPETPEEGDEGPEEAENDDPERKGGRESKLRKRAQEAEARVAELENAVSTLQRQVAESMAGPRSDGQRQLPGLKHPGDLWNHAEAGEVLGDDGAVSAELVASVVQRILTERPELGLRGQPRPDFSAGKGSAPSTATNWAEALRVANR